MTLRLAAIAACSICALCGCGQKGALFLPDHAPQPVLSAPAAPAAATPAAAPAPTPAADAATAPDATTTRKAPRDPDPATAR